jgi:hypothetical protein
MYQPEAYGIALLFMVGSMLCWGSWANTMKLTPGWPFQLFYWDYVIGIVVASLLWGMTLGSAGGGALSFRNNIHAADGQHIIYALLGGAVFNIANLLLVAAIDIAGLAVAFPVGIGLALVVGVLLNYIISPQGSPWLLFGGVALVVVAIVLDAKAYRRRETTQKALSARGIQLSLACGVLMGVFYPLVARATRGERFGDCALRCSRELLPYAQTPHRRPTGKPGRLRPGAPFLARVGHRRRHDLVHRGSTEFCGLACPDYRPRCVRCHRTGRNHGFRHMGRFRLERVRGRS